MIHELIQTMTNEEKESLHLKTSNSKSNLHKFIKAVLDDPSVSKEELQRKFQINENTYFKNLSLAKDEIYEVIKAQMKNAYDDLMLTNVLYRRGLDVQASKLRLKLENEYGAKGWWGVLNELHGLDMMVAYTKCDVPRMKQIRDKTISNIDRLHSFVKVDREVIVQMAMIEKGDLKEKEYAAYGANMLDLLEKAKKTDHPIPIFNTLHSLFILYTKYEIDLKKAQTIIDDIQQLVLKYGERMIPYTVNAAWLNTMNFHVIFATSEKASDYLPAVEKALGGHGLLFDAQAILIFCQYYFVTGDKKGFAARFGQFEKLAMDKSFQYKHAYLNCLMAYMNDDAKAFNQYLNEFYSGDTSREYDDYDLTLRYLDLIMLIREKNFSLATDKLEAAIKFARRNFTSYQIAIEKKHWDMLRACIQGKAAKTPTDNVYRLTTFIYDELTKK